MGDLVSVPGKGMLASPNPAQTEPQHVCFLPIEYARTRELLNVVTPTDSLFYLVASISITA